MTASSCHPDVFLSFRGEDVRRCFVSHLHEALKRKRINAFMDENIERGSPIGPTLSDAIKNSRVSIVVFSRNYASSTWCLNELLQIHKRLEEQTVIPIFHNVAPGDVRNQMGEFGRVFVKTCENGREDDKRRWMRALKDVANLAGEVLQSWHNEALMIEQIVNVVSKKLFSGTGSTNAQCSYSQSLRKNNVTVVSSGKDKVVNERIQIHSVATSTSRQTRTGMDKPLASAVSTNRQPSYSQSLRKKNATTGNEGVRTSDDVATYSWANGRPVARALAAAAAEQGANRRSGSNNVDKSQGNTNASIGKDKLVYEGTRTLASSSLITQKLVATMNRGYSRRDWIEQ